MAVVKSLTVLNGLVQAATGGAVALADQESLSASKLIGRGSGGAGIPEEISLGAGLTLTGNTLSASGGGGGGSSEYTAENKDSVTIRAGQPVATHSSGTGVIRASSASVGVSCSGLATADIAVGASGSIQTGGPLTLADWTNVTGAASLSARTVYFLSGTPANLTDTPPSTTGECVQVIGRSIGLDTLRIEIEVPILL